MAIRNAAPFTFRPFGCCDAIDGTNVQPGAMAALKNLIPNPRNIRQFIPRPASVQLSNFAGFSTPAGGTALIVIGSRAYGMIASALHAGKDEPFCYDIDAGVFIAIANVTAANSPTTQATSGDWEPPTMAQIANRIMITHPGYAGANKVGWIDTRGFTSNTATGSTHTTTVIDTLSANPLTVLGWAVGDQIAGAGIPAGTYIVSLAAASVVISQAAVASAAGVALTVTSGTRAAPLYGAGDTNTTALVARPRAVAQFNGRAWYAVVNGLQFTDALKPWQITNATQALTLGDDVSVSALAGIPLSTQLTGGIVQSLIAFKFDSPYWQITGDQATSDLKSDQVAGSVGTHAPNSLVPTPRGLAYISPEGLRIIDPQTGMATEPIGANGSGIAAPFLFAVAPSRMAAAFNKNTYRVSVQNGGVDGQPLQEWWYHFSLAVWTGPHDFPAAIIAPCYQPDTDFLMFASGVNGKLFESTITPSATSTYTENGVAMNMMWTTSLLPDNQNDAGNQIVESSLGLVLPANQVMTLSALDENGAPLDTITLAGDQAGASIWNSFSWGGGIWGGAAPPYRQYQMPWSKPLVFRQMSLTGFGPSVSGFTLGNIIAKVQTLGYQDAHA